MIVYDPNLERVNDRMWFDFQKSQNELEPNQLSNGLMAQSKWVRV